MSSIIAQGQTVLVTLPENADYTAQVQADATLYITLPPQQSNTAITLAGQGARVLVRAALQITAQQQAQHNINVTHAAAHTVSRQVVRALASDSARCTVNSDVHIMRGAKGADSQQSLQGLILNTGARHDLKPSLTVFDDDVKCSHGATTGSLNLDHMRYLRLRGLSEAEARALLTQAFLAAVHDVDF
jgi:Fe-S cluster assembly protein SufD